jgi:hypothetical protein
MENFVSLGDLLTELPEVTRKSTTGALDNSKRTRALNRILQDLQSETDLDIWRRTIEFDYIDGITEYSLNNYIDATCLNSDGSEEIGDFKSPYDLRLKKNNLIPIKYKESKEVRLDISRAKAIREYSVDVEADVLVINYPALASAVIHDCDSLTALGTVAAADSASNLTLDENVYEEGSGSFNFDLSGTVATLTISLTTPLDLSALENKAFLTLFVDLPTITNLTSIRARFGSSAAAYWEKTETVPVGGDLQVGRNQFAFSWANASQTGTPDDEAIDYISISITYSQSTTDTDFRIDNIRMAESTKMELEYYSLATVETSAGLPQLEFNADAVTQSDLLRGGNNARLALIKGGRYECFFIIGGKSERDRTDSYKEYEIEKRKLIRKHGSPVRRQSKRLGFAGGGIGSHRLYNEG